MSKCGNYVDDCMNDTTCQNAVNCSRACNANGGSYNLSCAVNCMSENWNQVVSQLGDCLAAQCADHNMHRTTVIDEMNNRNGQQLGSQWKNEEWIFMGWIYIFIFCKFDTTFYN